MSDLRQLRGDKNGGLIKTGVSITKFDKYSFVTI
jgi:hypothetical protein